MAQGIAARHHGQALAIAGGLVQQMMVMDSTAGHVKPSGI